MNPSQLKFSALKLHQSWGILLALGSNDGHQPCVTLVSCGPYEHMDRTAGLLGAHPFAHELRDLIPERITDLKITEGCKSRDYPDLLSSCRGMIDVNGQVLHYKTSSDALYDLSLMSMARYFRAVEHEGSGFAGSLMLIAPLFQIGPASEQAILDLVSEDQECAV